MPTVCTVCTVGDKSGLSILAEIPIKNKLKLFFLDKRIRPCLHASKMQPKSDSEKSVGTCSVGLIIGP